MRRLLLLSACLLCAGLAAADGWEPLRVTGRPADGPRAVPASLVEQIVAVFQRAGALNPPQGFRVTPRAEFGPGASLPDGTIGPPSAIVAMAMHFGVAEDPVASVLVRVNDPSGILGPAILTDSEGEIFLLPPVAPGPADRQLFLRSAHPAGFAEVFPVTGSMPLWGQDAHPFYRSVVRPHFSLLSNAAATVLTAADRPFWTPVTQERWITALIGRARGELQTFLAGSQAAEQTNLTDRQIDQMRRFYAQMRSVWDESAIVERYQMMVDQAQMAVATAKHFGRPIPQAQYDAMIEMAEKSMNEFLAQAPEARAELEKQEAQLVAALLTRGSFTTRAEAAIRARAWDDLDALGREYDLPQIRHLADAGRCADALEAELAGLSPAARRAPAYGFELPPVHPLGPHRNVVALDFEPARPSGLVAPDAPGARALVSLDPAFFRAGSGKAALITVKLHQKHEPWDLLERRGMARRPGRSMLEDIWTTLDWTALQAMVR